MKTDKDGQRLNTGPIPDYKKTGKKTIARILKEAPMPWNPKLTHRATTAMREAFEKAVRTQAWHAVQHIPQTVIKVADALAHNAGVMRVPDVSLNVTTKTWNQLKQLKAV